MIAQDYTRVKDYLNKTKLKTLDYVINPYVGCPYNCLYCYASYMASFSKHNESWGNFIDVKCTNKKINTFKIKNKKVMISTVTDPYNPYEKEFGVTRKILQQLVKSEALISVVTKSNLVLRDIDLFKQMKHIEVGLSISFLDEELKSKLEPASPSVSDRIEALKILKYAGIKTVCHISPIIPGITDIEKIIEATKDYVDEYTFDKLDLRSSFKTKMFNFIKLEYPDLIPLYQGIYVKKTSDYFKKIADDITNYCNKNNITYNINYKTDDNQELREIIAGT